MLGWAVAIYSSVNTESQFRNKQIDSGRRTLSHLNNGAGVLAPRLAIPIAAGDYLGQRYANEVNAIAVEPGGFVYEAFKSTFEFLGIPTEPK